MTTMQDQPNFAGQHDQPRREFTASKSAHGMGKDLVLPYWPPLEGDEIHEILRQYNLTPVEFADSDDHILWSSPRPMSAAAIVQIGPEAVFIKRHYHAVHDAEDLQVEHAFGTYLRSKGVPVPEVLRTPSGATVVEREDYLYEVHAGLHGLDLYRDAISWSPFKFVSHARSAGRALAEFHRAACGFPAPARQSGVLQDSVQLSTASDPRHALDLLLCDRPALTAALSKTSFDEDFAAHLRSPLRRAATVLGATTPQWTHGDWHPSNLTWTSYGADAVVKEIFDLGLSNLTFAMHDLALAIERSAIDWLDLAGTGTIGVDIAALDALIRGYEELAPLSRTEREALIAVLPVVHVEYAMSEIEYFAAVAPRPDDVVSAYKYLIGHAAWFETADGTALLDHIGARSAQE